MKAVPLSNIGPASKREKPALLNQLAEGLVDLTDLSEAVGDEFLTYLITMARIEAATLANKIEKIADQDFDLKNLKQ